MQLTEILNAFESVLVSAAVIAGGVWAFRNFRVLRQRDRSDAELERTRAEIESLKRSLHKRAVLELRLLADQLWFPDTRDLIISVTVEVRNRGNRLAMLRYGDRAPFSATEVSLASDGELQLGKRFEANLVNPTTRSPAPFSSLFPGEMERLPCLIRVNKPCVYLLAVRTEAGEENVEIMGSIESHQSASWHCTAYFRVVEDPSEAAQQPNVADAAICASD